MTLRRSTLTPWARIRASSANGTTRKETHGPTRVPGPSWHTRRAARGRRSEVFPKRQPKPSHRLPWPLCNGSGVCSSTRAGRSCSTLAAYRSPASYPTSTGVSPSRFAKSTGATSRGNARGFTWSGCAICETSRPRRRTGSPRTGARESTPKELGANLLPESRSRPLRNVAKPPSTLLIGWSSSRHGQESTGTVQSVLARCAPRVRF